MERSEHPPHPPSHAAPWHALLAPLPAGEVPRRQPVASREVLATPAGAAIAGWEQLVVELSAGMAGMRVAMVVLDGSGVPISASDMVMYRVAGDGGDADSGSGVAPVVTHHESIGGRLEPDGSFHGTRWRGVSVEASDSDEPQIQSSPSEPTTGDVAALTALVAEIVRRGAIRGDSESGQRGGGVAAGSVRPRQ